MKNARQLKTIALNLLTDSLEAINLEPAGINVPAELELDDEDKGHIVTLFQAYKSQLCDRVESRADRSAKKLAARVKAQVDRTAAVEKRKRAAEEREAAKEAKKQEREAAKAAKATPKVNGKPAAGRAKAVKAAKQEAVAA